MTAITDASKGGDALMPHRKAVGDAIVSLRSFKGNAGTDEMHAAHAALMHVGIAYAHLANAAGSPALETNIAPAGTT